jgi:hypothetical protein
VLSHESAARLLGLGALAVPRYVFTALAELPAPRATIIHIERLAAADVTVVEGLPVTTPFRTILDLMRGFTDHDDLGRALDVAVRRDLVELQEVYDAMLPLAPAHSFPTAGPDFVAYFLPDLNPSGLAPRNLRAYAELTAADSVAEAQSQVAVLLAELRYPIGAQHSADDGLSRQIAAEIVGRLRRKEDDMTDASDQANPGTDDTDGQRCSQRTFSPEAVGRAREKIRREEAERRRRPAAVRDSRGHHRHRLRPGFGGLHQHRL